MSKKLGVASAVMGAVVGLTSIGNASAEEVANQQVKQENTNQNLEKQGGNKQGNGDVNERATSNEGREINRLRDIDYHVESYSIIEPGDKASKYRVHLQAPGLSKLVKKTGANLHGNLGAMGTTVTPPYLSVSDSDNLTITGTILNDELHYGCHVTLKLFKDGREIDAYNIKFTLSDEVKSNAKEEVNQLLNLSQQEKNDFNTQIDNAKTQDDVDKVVQAAKDKDKQNAGSKLEEAKTNGKNEVNKLPNLSQQEKNDFNSQIDNAKTQDDVDKIVQAAKDKDTENGQGNNQLADAKINAHTEIDKLLNLTEQEKQKYKDKVDKANNIDAVNKVVTDAKKKDKNNYEVLSLAKEMAINTIGHLSSLDEGQKTNFVNQINAAKSVDEVNAIKDTAWNQSRK